MGISFIIPYCGERKYIQECLESLENQTCKEFEALVVCDHCDEEDKRAVTELSLSFPVTLLDTGEKTGVAAARNIGLAASRQEFVFFMDCDDFLRAGAVESMLAAARESDIVYVRRYYSWIGYRGFLEMEKLPDDSTEKHTYINTSRIEREDKTFPLLPDNATSWETVFYHLLKSVICFTFLSALNLLYRREMLVQNAVTFDEQFIYQADMGFLAKAFCCTERVAELTEEPYYVKRRRNDPINLPSLAQRKDATNKAMEVMRAYLYVKEVIRGKNEFIESCFDCKFVKDYVRQTIAAYMKEKSSKKVKELRSLADECLPLISKEALKLARPYTRRSVNYSLTHTTEKIAARARRHSAFQTFKRTIGRKRKMIPLIYRKLLLRFPIKEKMILFETFFGRNYSDSPKYIFEYISQQYSGEYECIWVLNKKTKLPYPAKQVKRFSLRYYYYMARSKYFVYNVRQPKSFIKRKGTVFLETWHGTPLKRLVFDQVEVSGASPLYKEQVYNQSRSWDYLIAPNQFSSDIFRSCFMYDKEMLETGYPRNDILHLPEDERERQVGEIKNNLGIPLDKKVILYAPTWRDDEFFDKGQYRFTLQLDLARMQETLGDEYVVVLRTHYFIVNVLDLSAYQGFVFNASTYDDIAHLYLIADLMITDYSSVFFDYANLRRPILFFMYDIEKYRDALRGFYIDIEEELPGPILMTSDEVIATVQNLPQVEQTYEEKYRVFYEKYCGWENGTSTKQVVETVFHK